MSDRGQSGREAMAGGEDEESAAGCWRPDIPCEHQEVATTFAAGL